MESKVKKFFSEIFVNAYDYPFIIGFLEASQPPTPKWMSLQKA